jgi:serine/threonine-protein kinase
MRDRKLIGPVARGTSRTSTAGVQRALPGDLLKDASHRLGVMCIVAAALWTVGVVLGHLAVRAMSHGDPQWRKLSGTDAIAASAVLASILLFFYTRRPNRDPRRILDLGLLYMILTGIDLGFLFHWAPMPMEQSVIAPQISWIGAIVLMFAAIVPTTRSKSIIAGLIAVSMNPLAMLIARAQGKWNFESASDVLLMHYPDYLLVGVAVVIAQVVTSLGQQVAKAREMGSYELGALLGRGGMGEVYKATHRMLARPAAIKLIRPEMIAAGDPEGAQLAVLRFRREAEAAANLRSPHTVELYDFGVTDDETLYFVMELLEGLDLETLVKNHGPQPANRVVHVIRQVCESLEEAHARGLVHRDIKPANIHLGRLGLVYDFVKVLDFGLVKPTSERGAVHSLATQAGLIIGTPGYMAPEMALRDDIDGRADIYALGCVAYFLLTGHQVFEGTSAMQVMSKHLQSPPVPPSARTTMAIPADLDAVVLRCLAKDPEERPQSAKLLAERLAAIDVDPWTDAAAQAWWLANPPASHTAGDDESTSILGQASSEDETRLSPRAFP